MCGYRPNSLPRQRARSRRLLSFVRSQWQLAWPAHPLRSSVRGGCAGPTLAYASTCERDQWDRPIFGYANFCPTARDRKFSSFSDGFLYIWSNLKICESIFCPTACDPQFPAFSYGFSYILSSIRRSNLSSKFANPFSARRPVTSNFLQFLMVFLSF